MAGCPQPPRPDPINRLSPAALSTAWRLRTRNWHPQSASTITTPSVGGEQTRPPAPRQRDWRSTGGRFDGVADDSVGEDALDGAAVDLALAGRLLGHVGDPLAVRFIGHEVPLDLILVHRLPRLPVKAALAHGRGSQLLLRTHPPRTTLPDVDAGPLELVGEKPGAERGIFRVGAYQDVDDVRVLKLPITDGTLEPGVDRLGGEDEHSTDQPHREALGGQMTDQRVLHFQSEFAANQAATRRSISFSISSHSRSRLRCTILTSSAVMRPP